MTSAVFTRRAGATGGTLTLTADEQLATVTHVKLDGSATAAPVIKGSRVSFAVGNLHAGRHVVIGTLTDAAGLTAPFTLRFTAAGTRLTATLAAPRRRHGSVSVSVKVSTKATLTLRLVSPTGTVVSTRRVGAAGRVRVSLPLPPKVRGGRWTVRLTATGGGVTVKKSTAFSVAVASGFWVIVRGR
ncbi:MAG: hypothetical protein ACXWYS_05275 [Gaiellaceae bacterium]